MLKSILQDFPNTDISVSIVWIDMLPADNAAAAKRAAKTLDDPRVRHFHDPRRTHRAGKAFAKGLLHDGGGPAWDVYLFYSKGDQWKDRPPRPVEWLHQLSGGKRADATHFRTGKDLVDKLHEAMHKVTGDSCRQSSP